MTVKTGKFKLVHWIFWTTLYMMTACRAAQELCEVVVDIIYYDVA